VNDRRNRFPAELRVSIAEAARMFNVSEESVRKAGLIHAYGTDEMVRLIDAGEMSIDAAYKAIRGDQRVGLYVKVHPTTRDLVKQAAAERGLTTSQLIEALVALIFGEEEAASDPGQTP
jgi:hypothetical protein